MRSSSLCTCALHIVGKPRTEKVPELRSLARGQTVTAGPDAEISYFGLDIAYFHLVLRDTSSRNSRSAVCLDIGVHG